MKYLKIAFGEIVGMFIDDGALALAAFLLILALSAAVKLGLLDPLPAAFLLLVGCVAIVAESLIRSARNRLPPKR